MGEKRGKEGRNGVEGKERGRKRWKGEGRSREGR